MIMIYSAEVIFSVLSGFCLLALKKHVFDSFCKADEEYYFFFLSFPLQNYGWYIRKSRAIYKTVDTPPSQLKRAPMKCFERDLQSSESFCIAVSSLLSG